MVVHGDDFTLLGSDSALDWMKRELEKEYELKHGGRIGPEERDAHEARVLNRVVTWDCEGLRMEADQRHVEIALKQLGLEDCKAVATPGTSQGGDDEDEMKELNETEIRVFRSVGARLNYLSVDRPEIQYAAKEFAE